MTFRESLSLRIRACALILLSQIQEKSVSSNSRERIKAENRLASFSKNAAIKGCGLGDVLYNYILGCLRRRKAFSGISFMQALELYEREQVSRRVYSQPSPLSQEIKRYEFLTLTGTTEVYRIEKKRRLFGKRRPSVRYSRKSACSGIPPERLAVYTLYRTGRKPDN
jgi:hypothetical protein